MPSTPSLVRATGLARPTWFYDNWAAQDNGMGEGIYFTEELSFHGLEQLLRYRRLGVAFEYYMLNFGWYDDAGGGYRRWRQEDWPEGPDRFLAACAENDVKVGLWIGGNTLWRGEPPEEWLDSASEDVEGQWPPFRAFSMTEGGFLPHLMETLQQWYDRGIRVFEIDNANLSAATAEARATLSVAEIRRGNREAFAEAIAAFRARNPEVLVVGFNGFGDADYDSWHEQLGFASTARPLPAGGMTDPGWLDTFDTLYSGDIRVSDVPLASFWRSVDLYGDHMVRRYQQSGLPLARIDAFFTLSTTFFGYHRGSTAWRSMLVLTQARGGWKKTIYGSLELLDDEEVAWFVRVADLFADLQESGLSATFGATPGEGDPYGFFYSGDDGGLVTLVNPAQEIRDVALPPDSDTVQRRVLFRDAGFPPELGDGSVRLGPGQLALVGYGRYADPAFDLGIEPDVVIPARIRALPLDVVAAEDGIVATVRLPERGDLRIVVERTGTDGLALRGAPPTIEAEQDGTPVDLRSRAYDGTMSPEDWFAGLSWQVGELSRADLDPGRPIRLRLRSGGTGALRVRGYAVEPA